MNEFFNQLLAKIEAIVLCDGSLNLKMVRWSTEAITVGQTKQINIDWLRQKGAFKDSETTGVIIWSNSSNIAFTYIQSGF